MKNHVVSLELAKQLKEAGYPEAQRFYWVKPSSAQKPFVVSRLNMQQRDPDTLEISIAAPLATELLEQLPASVEDEEFGLAEIHIYKQEQDKWLVIYDTEEGTILSKECKNKSLPDALAMMYLYLKKEGRI